MNVDPFADLQLDPQVKQAADSVRATMSTWIDGQVNNLTTQMNARAATVANAVTLQAQTELTRILNESDNSLDLIEKQLKAITANFTDPGLKVQSDRLQAAIDAHQAAVAQQKAQVQQFGQLIGTVIQKALTSAA